MSYYILYHAIPWYIILYTILYYTMLIGGSTFWILKGGLGTEQSKAVMGEAGAGKTDCIATLPFGQRFLQGTGVAKVGAQNHHMHRTMSHCGSKAQYKGDTRDHAW